MVKVITDIAMNVPSWWRPQSGKLFDIFMAYKKIGSCSLAIVEDQNPPSEGRSFFPSSWFVDGHSNRMMPILEIDGIETFNRMGCGNGRACLQALYEFSKRRGCGGRMQVCAGLNSGGFYEHCGFTGLDTASDGLKYFNPTQQNLAYLFPNGLHRNEFRFIPVATDKETKELSQKDKALFDRMLQKAHH